MKHLWKSCLPIVLLILGAGDVLGQDPSAANGLTFVVVADGAGGYATLSDNLLLVVRDPPFRCRRIVICRIPWARDDDNLNDYRDIRRHLAGAVKMVGEIQRIRNRAPDSPIVLVGYSAGASVVLPAAEMLPPNSVERIILLGPAVSARLDPRRALLACKAGIDSFNSPGDDFFQSMEEEFGAPYECRGSKIAGNVGFLVADPRFGIKDPLLCKLHQHDVSWLLNGHFGTVTPRFLAHFVLPLIPWAAVTPVCEK
jgi:pimeloyl-ACP methyl ester carboxylesterase